MPEEASASDGSANGFSVSSFAGHSSTLTCAGFCSRCESFAAVCLAEAGETHRTKESRRDVEAGDEQAELHIEVTAFQRPIVTVGLIEW